MHDGIKPLPYTIEALQELRRARRIVWLLSNAPRRTHVVRDQLAAMGGQPVLRQGFRTDNGNEILDVHNLKITDPVALEEKIGLLVGVVEVGLFARRGADILLVASDGGVKTLKR